VVPPKTTTWAIEPHTKAKHDLLRRYLGAWFPIMASREEKLAFIDGFAGPGCYEDGSTGSPIVALDTLVTHRNFAGMGGTKFNFIFVDEDPRRTASLRTEVDSYFDSVGGRPTNISVRVVDGTFDGAANELVDSITKGFVLVPTLAFIDPFGFKGISMDTISRLTSFPKGEVVFSFMYDGLNRWITHPDEAIHVNLRDLFGTDDYEDADGLNPDDRRDFLHDVYKRQLQKAGDFKYTLDFEMVDRRGKNVYSLIFGTRHMRGLEAMKEAMWVVDPSGSFRFSDRHAGMTSLFGEKPDIEPLRKAILERYAGEQVTIEKLHEFVLEDTIFGKNHYRREVLAKLEKAGVMSVVNSSRKRANGYPPGTVLRFQ
jgi:three-Cys-motif partner protein